MKTRKTQLAKAKKKSYWNERRDRKKVRVRTKWTKFEGTNECIVKAAQKNNNNNNNTLAQKWHKIPKLKKLKKKNDILPANSFYVFGLSHQTTVIYRWLKSTWNILSCVLVYYTYKNMYTKFSKHDYDSWHGCCCLM